MLSYGEDPMLSYGEDLASSCIFTPVQVPRTLQSHLQTPFTLKNAAVRSRFTVLNLRCDEHRSTLEFLQLLRSFTNAWLSTPAVAGI